MKKIFLIGDSIMFGAPNSSGYGVWVREKLKDKAEVYFPDENCRFAEYTLRYLCEWAENCAPIGCISTMRVQSFLQMRS